MHSRIGRLSAFLALTSAAWLVAQFQTSNQLNNQLYGGGTTGSVRYSGYQTGTSNLLPSEMRNATWRSGALPSEIRMNAAAVGPLPPQGAAAYLPPPTPITQRPLVQSSAFTAGTVRYPNASTITPNSTLLTPRSLTPAPMR